MEILPETEAHDSAGLAHRVWTERQQKQTSSRKVDAGQVYNDCLPKFTSDRFLSTTSAGERKTA